MTTTDYLISAVLVLLVIPQVRGTRLNPRNLLLPLVLVGAAAAYYLKTVPTQGHDVALDVATVLVGVLIGAACAYTTRLRRQGGGAVVAKAGLIAALLWIVGMAARTGFAYEANHGGRTAIVDFSRAEHITGASAWTAALVLMALAQVVARLVLLRVRARGLASVSARASSLATA
jgi:hypothetical protein